MELEIEKLYFDEEPKKELIGVKLANYTTMTKLLMNTSMKQSAK